MNHQSKNRFLSSSSGSPSFSSSFSSSSSSKYVPPSKKYNHDRFQRRPESDISSSSRPNRFLKASSFKSSSADGWKTSNNRQTGNRFSNSNRGYKFSGNEKKNEFTSSDGDFPTLGGGGTASTTNVVLNKYQTTLNYSNAINEDIEIHRKNNQQSSTRKFISLVPLKKKKKNNEVEFEEDIEREEDYVETTYFTEDEEEEYYGDEYYQKEDQERLRRAEEDYDY